MSSTYGERLKLSIFGQSHGAAIGMTLDGIPAGLPVDLKKLQEFLNRRAPGQNDYSTPRKEADQPVLSMDTPAVRLSPQLLKTQTPAQVITAIRRTVHDPVTQTIPHRSNTVAIRTPLAAAIFPVVSQRPCA